MTREELQTNAKELGIDISNMTWNDAVSAVCTAMRAQKKLTDQDEVIRLRAQLAELQRKNDEYEIKYKKKAPGRPPTREELLTKTVLIAPFIPDGGQHLGNYEYEEELGNDIDYEEDHLSLDRFARMKSDEVGVNYKIKGKKENKVIAQSRGPVENCMISFNPLKDWCAVATMPNQEPMYILQSDVYYDVIDLIKPIRGGIYWRKFKASRIENERYIGGHICVPRDWVHAIMDYITQEEVRRAKEGYIDVPV